jgi:lipopolysaccharide export system permease protein
MFVRDVQGRKLIDAIFQHRPKGLGHVHDFVIRAREAELDVDLESSKLIVKMYDGEMSNPRDEHITFVYHEEVIDLPQLWETGHIARARDMSWTQLEEKRAELLLRIETMGEEGRDPEQLRLGQQTILGSVRQIEAELQMRPALSFGCLCFVLIGCPVGIWFSRSDYLSAFITCFLPIVFVYYPLMLCGTNFAKEGKFDPILTVWAADALVAFIGVVLFAKLLRN